MQDIYRRSVDNKWRFTLGRSGGRPLVVVGLNPGTATDDKADATLAKVERVAALHGFDGFILVNLYPWRSTDPAALPRERDAARFAGNVACVREVLRGRQVWAGWGNGIVERPVSARRCGLLRMWARGSISGR